MSAEKPLPCPFCGEEPMDWSPPGVRCITAGCAIEGCGPHLHTTHEAAIAAWNTRADPVRAALAVPGVAGLLTKLVGWGDSVNAEPEIRTALRVLADAAKEAGRG